MSTHSTDGSLILQPYHKARIFELEQLRGCYAKEILRRRKPRDFTYYWKVYL